MTDKPAVPGLRSLLEDTLGLKIDDDLRERLERKLGTTIDDDPARWGEIGSDAERAAWITAHPEAFRA